MQFLHLGLLASATIVSAIPVLGQTYNEDILKRQVYTCEANAIYCNSFNSFSVCTPGENGNREVFFGPTADGTYCDEYENRIRTENSGDCSPDGQLFCDYSGQTFFESDQVQWNFFI